MTFTNVGDLPDTATATAGKEGTWDTGALSKGVSKAITFDNPGAYYYICTRVPGCTGRLSWNPEPATSQKPITSWLEISRCPDW